MNKLLLLSAFLLNDVDFYQNEWKERIKKEWKLTNNMPRKKKKKKRKSLILDWKIASFNPFDIGVN